MDELDQKFKLENKLESILRIHEARIQDADALNGEESIICKELARTKTSDEIHHLMLDEAPKGGMKRIDPDEAHKDTIFEACFIHGADAQLAADAMYMLAVREENERLKRFIQEDVNAKLQQQAHKEETK